MFDQGQTVIATVYGIAALAICSYGIHRLWLTWRLLRDRRVRRSPAPAGRFTELPKVTVQLPMFNERYVARRIIDAACALDYPRDRLQIQVLDDSNDDSADIARIHCERMAAAGHPITHLHRTERIGFKSGALAAGLETAPGELVAIFDADFLPRPDFLRRTVAYFTDPKVGVVQAAWSHLNRSESWLTELQAVFLDGHFVVEQAVRSFSGRWFNFNGTAGVWRRTCIEDAGGWQHDTLTEDTDLSYRAQLAGWRFVYLPKLRCKSELPSTMTAFLDQQHRWTKGLIQTARKLLPRIMLSGAPWSIKIEAWFHLTAPFLYLLMFLVSAVALPAMVLVTPFNDHANVALWGLCALFVGTLGAATFYVVSQRVQGRPLVATLIRIPLLMALGIGICAVNARAVVEALLGLRSPFVRTPKFGRPSDGGDGDAQPVVARRRPRLPAGLLELLMAGELGACFVLGFQRPGAWMGAPLLFLCALGYAGVGVRRLLDPFATRTPRVPLLRTALSRFAAGALGAGVVAAGGLATLRLMPAAPRVAEAPRFAEAPRPRAVSPLDLDLTHQSWQVQESGAIRNLHTEGGSWNLEIRLDESTAEGAIVLDVNAMTEERGEPPGSLFRAEGYGVWLDAPERQLVFDVEVPAGFAGELQAFVKDGQGRREYGSMRLIERSDTAGAMTVTLTPAMRTPAMGYRDEGFDLAAGINEVGLKMSAESDRIRRGGYRAFAGTIRLTRVGIANVNPEAAPEILTPARADRALPIVTEAELLGASGVDRPWPVGYAFAGPVTPAVAEELDRTYAAIAAQGCRFTRVYVGDYRKGLMYDESGKVSGVEAAFFAYLDELVEVANRHGITVMLSLTDNAMLNGGETKRVELVRVGEASDAFVDHVIVELVKKLEGRDVIWDIFNEPENVTSLPLREIQRYVDRVLVAGRRADPRARFTVVSRSRPEIVYWQGRGLSLYSHNIFTERSLDEALAAPRTLEAPILVAEMAPALVSRSSVEALRRAGYAGIGIWGWGTLDKYEWPEADLELRTRPLRGLGNN